MEKELREKIRKNPRDAMNYYYLGKELMKRPLKDIYSLQEIENLFKEAIRRGPQLWAPKISLGELLFKMGRFKEAEIHFRESLGRIPQSVSVKEYLTKCIAKKSNIKEDIDEVDSRDALYLFENNVREFIRIILEEEHYDNWWREGVPKQVRSKCASRREEGLIEEKDADLLLFADFYDYKMIIENNKNLFASFIDIREWGTQLTLMEPIRNAIAHNRPLTNAPTRIIEYYQKFQKVLEKVKNKNISQEQNQIEV